MGKTKSIDTHNGGWKQDVGRKGTGAPGKKRKQTSKKLGKFKDFTEDDGKKFEQKVPAKQKRMMMMMKDMQEKRAQKEANGGKGGKHNSRAATLDTGADSVHPDKAKRQQKKERKEKNGDSAVAQWMTTENGGRGGLDGPDGVEAPTAAPSTGRKPLERLPDEPMKDYSKRLKEYTRKNMITDIRDSKKKAAKQKAWLQNRKIGKKEKRKVSFPEKRRMFSIEKGGVSIES